MTDQPNPDKKPEQDNKAPSVPGNSESSQGSSESSQAKAVDKSLEAKSDAEKMMPPTSKTTESQPMASSAGKSNGDSGNAPIKPAVPSEAKSEEKADTGVKPTTGDLKSEDKPNSTAAPTAVSEAKSEDKSGAAAKSTAPLKPEPEGNKPDLTTKPAPSLEIKPSESKSPAEGQTTRNLNDPELLKEILTSASKEGKLSQPIATQKLPDREEIAKGGAPGTASAIQICPTCGHHNRPGVILCDNCGTNLMTGQKAAFGTRDLKKEQEAKAEAQEKLLDTNQAQAVETAGGTTFTENMVLRIEIEGGSTPMLVYPKQEIIMGRRDPNTGGMPDVDLTAYAGYRMGVSRRHAAIRLQEQHLHVSDLGSSNGTFLNGTRLNAHRPYQLRDGDEVRLGQMVLKVFFQTNREHN